MSSLSEMTMTELAKAARIQRMQNEGRDGCNPYQQEMELRQIAQADAKFAAEWTREVTQQRRTDWNARVRNGEFTRHGKVDLKLVAAAQKAQGWALTSLKVAIEMHGLDK